MHFPGPDTGRAPQPSLHRVSRQISSWVERRALEVPRDSPEHGAVAGRGAPRGPVTVPCPLAPLAAGASWVGQCFQGLLEPSGGPPHGPWLSDLPEASPPSHCSGGHGQQAGPGVRCSSELRGLCPGSFCPPGSCPEGTNAGQSQRVPVLSGAAQPGCACEERAPWQHLHHCAPVRPS